MTKLKTIDINDLIQEHANNDEVIYLDSNILVSKDDGASGVIMYDISFLKPIQEFLNNNDYYDFDSLYFDGFWPNSNTFHDCFSNADELDEMTQNNNNITKEQKNIIKNLLNW